MTTLIASLLIIGYLICFILVLIRLFKTKGALHGILGIFCGIYPFIWGWINVKALNLKNIMIAWTVCLVLMVPLNIMAGAGAVMEAQKVLQQQGAATP